MFLLNVADLLLYYKQLIYNHLQFFAVLRKTLQISYIGMQTQEVAIKPRVQVTLKSDSEMLDEVVVVAYGTASRQSITGAVASIDSKKLEMRPVTEVTGTLEGAAPGIQVNNSYGEPGSDKSEIRIRGFGSVNGTNAPLIVVDVLLMVEV